MVLIPRLQSETADLGKAKRPQSSESTPPGFADRPLEIQSVAGKHFVTHQQGTIEIPSHPKRICSLAFTDELVALGIRPTSASCTNGQFPDYLRKRLQNVVGINQMMGVGQPDFETIVETKPDLIIASAGDPQTYRQLLKIAPVVLLSGDGDNNRQRMFDLGRLLDREAEAAACIKNYDAKIRQARKLLSDELGSQKVAFFRIFGKQFYIHGHTRGGIMLYDELKLNPPTLLDSSPKGFLLTPESLLQLDADLIFLAVEANQGAQRSWSQLLDHPAWERVPAVRSKRVIMLPMQHHWLRPGFLAKSQMLDEIIQSCSRAEGQAKTNISINANGVGV